MHEMSLVRSLLRQVEQLRRQHGGLAVQRIEVEIGPLSGVEPLLVSEAFDTLAVEENISGTQLVIQEVPLTGHCVDCRAEFEILEFDFHCALCKSPSIRITGGDEFRLLNFTLQTDQPIESSQHRAAHESEANMRAQL